MHSNIPSSLYHTWIFSAYSGYSESSVTSLLHFESALFFYQQTQSTDCRIYWKHTSPIFWAFHCECWSLHPGCYTAACSRKLAFSLAINFTVIAVFWELTNLNFIIKDLQLLRKQNFNTFEDICIGLGNYFICFQIKSSRSFWLLWSVAGEESVDR